MSCCRQVRCLIDPSATCSNLRPKKICDYLTSKDNYNFTLQDGESIKDFSVLQWTTNWKLVFSYRVFMAVYVLAWFIADVTMYEKNNYWAYLTHWSETIMVLYFFVALLVFVSDQLSNIDKPSCLLYHKIMWVLFDVYATSAIFVSIAYRVGLASKLFDKVSGISPLNIHVHVINSVLAVIELTLNNLPVRILHFYWPLTFGLTYSIFTLIFHWSGEKSDLYYVLDWENHPSSAVGYVFLILVFASFLHICVVCVLMRIRIFVATSIKNCNNIQQV